MAKLTIFVLWPPWPVQQVPLQLSKKTSEIMIG
jgi:hypothetical protein